jgi:voltage-gated potassium channel
MDFRTRVWELLEAKDWDGDGRTDMDWLDWTTICLILANVVAIVMGTVPDVRSHNAWGLGWFQWVSVVYFTLEYFARAWACTADDQYNHPVYDRIKYMTSGLGIVDLLAVGPFWLSLLFQGHLPADTVEFLMLFRLFWVLKLARYSVTVTRLTSIVHSRRHELTASFAFVFVLVIFASAGIYFFERTAQPDKFGSIPLAMWWSVVTLTTIGYGDVYPITAGGRIFASLVAIAGIGMVALPAGILASAFSQEFTRAEMKEEVEDRVTGELDDVLEPTVDDAVEDALDRRGLVCPTCGRPHDDSAASPDGPATS